MDIKSFPKVNGLFPFASNLYKQGNFKKKKIWHHKTVRLEKIEDLKFKELFSTLKEEFKFMEKIVENYEIAFSHNDLLGLNFIWSFNILS